MEGVLYQSPERGDKVVDGTRPAGPGLRTGEEGEELVREEERVCAKETSVRGKREGPVRDGAKGQEPRERISERVGAHWNKREA